MAGTTGSAASPAFTMIIDQSAHLDWDWIRTFGQNYWYYTNGEGVDHIITAAITNIQNASPNHPPYYYTVCEMAFLRRYIETNISRVGEIQRLGDNFQVISGGITSADCLVCSGEGFIRNYLVGQKWLKTVLNMTPKPHCWLPDDFGQGPELPALLAALGFESVAFMRLPGNQDTYENLKLRDDLIKNSGVDFTWKSSDGSTVLAHWLLDPKGDKNAGYSFGNYFSKRSYEAMNDFVNTYGQSKEIPHTYTGAKTRFMYIPIDDDFSMPIKGLADYISAWNSNDLSKGIQGASASNVIMKQGTFDDFVAQLKENASKLMTRNYNGTPYWTGYYASRPELKTLHYDTVRALTAAEVIGLLTKPSDKTLNSMLPTGFWTRIDQLWDDFAPSTHHDYICGTANDSVYAGEQLPLLRGTAAAARSLCSIALNALSGMTTNMDGSPSVIVVNPLGFARSGVAIINDIMPPSVKDGGYTQSISWSQINGANQPTQVTADGGMLVYADVQSFGYNIGKCESSTGKTVDKALLTPTKSGEASYTIYNEFLSARITEAAGWGLANLADTKGNGTEVLNGIGNAITFCDDSSAGDMYQFSNEHEWNSMPVIRGSDIKVTTSGAGLGAVVLETGPLRSRLRTEVSIDVRLQDETYTKRFVREYELRAGEPFLRMTTTGAAPLNTSVMTTFPLARPVKTITHGTGYHWTKAEPTGLGLWAPPVFQATHDFLIPQDASGATLAAMYHSAMPAWAHDEAGALIGCLLRNTPVLNFHGAVGSDPAPHTQHYALRVPTGLEAPISGQPLREARGFNTPLLAAVLPESGQMYKGMLTARSASLASVMPPADIKPPTGSAAMLTVAKPGSYDPGSLILRLYQPTNGALDVRVSLPKDSPTESGSGRLVTATETEWSGKGEASLNGDVIDVSMVGAVATVRIPGLGRGYGT